MGQGHRRSVTARRLLVAAAMAAALGPGGRARAHTTSTGLARISVDGAAVVYRLTLVRPELPEQQGRLLGAAADGDPASAEQVAAALRDRVRLRVGEGICQPGRVRVQGSRLADDRVELELRLRCPSAPGRLSIREDWADLFGEHYRTLARVDGPGGVREVALGAESREAVVEMGGEAPRGDTGFFKLGMEHILGGYDHLLFLAALLLRGGSLLALLEIVTAFTLAHSLTLALAVLGVVTIPSRVVEPAIAASIVWVAIQNVRSREPPRRRWLVSFAFGLVHGFGFASALSPLGLPAWPLARALLLFNLGVEAGQALVVAAALPLLVWMRQAAWEPRAVRLASVVLALLGTAWFVQRVFFV
jgi:hydrogenase/urease accessory protein HupE